MKTDVLVVGAGLAGSSAARNLAEAGRSVLVVERLRHPAGHCHDKKNSEGITVHTCGPHIFHTVNPAVWRFVNRFTAFRYYQHKVLSFAEGRLYNFPINLDTINDIFGTALTSSGVEQFLEKEVSKAVFQSPPGNFRDAVVAQVGERLYELFFRNYTRKQWGREPEELSADIAKRIPVRSTRDDRYFSDQYQGIPVPGYTEMVEKMLDHPNISLMLGTDYFAVSDQIEQNLLIYTGELDRFFDYKYGKLEYRSLDLEIKTFDSEYYQPAAVVNYPNDYDWTRISEFKYFSGEQSPKTTVCFEYPKAEGEPYYVVLTADNLDRKARYKAEAAAMEATGRYLFIGRLAEYTYYNMDQVIAAALDRTAGFPSGQGYTC